MTELIKMVLTAEKRGKAYKKWEELEEQRGEELYDYIEDNPLKSTNELSKELDIPRSSLKILLAKFIEGGLLIEEQKAINNRLTKLYRIKKFNEYGFDVEQEEDTDQSIIDPAMIEHLFKRHGIFQVSPDAIVTFNSLFSNLCVKIVENSALMFQTQHPGDVFTKDDLKKYFNETIITLLNK